MGEAARNGGLKKAGHPIRGPAKQYFFSLVGFSTSRLNRDRITSQEVRCVSARLVCELVSRARSQEV
jgi:hypothetical protein